MYKHFFLVKKARQLISIYLKFSLFIRPCQIDLLFSVTRTHVKKLGALNLFIQKLARLSFLFVIGEKKNFSYISILKIN